MAMMRTKRLLAAYQETAAGVHGKAPRFDDPMATYTCPPGHRAILRTVSLVSWFVEADLGCGIWLVASGLPIQGVDIAFWYPESVEWQLMLLTDIAIDEGEIFGVWSDLMYFSVTLTGAEVPLL